MCSRPTYSKLTNCVPLQNFAPLCGQLLSVFTRRVDKDSQLFSHTQISRPRLLQYVTTKVLSVSFVKWKALQFQLVRRICPSLKERFTIFSLCDKFVSLSSTRNIPVKITCWNKNASQGDVKTCYLNINKQKSTWHITFLIWEAIWKKKKQTMKTKNIIHRGNQYKKLNIFLLLSHDSCRWKACNVSTATFKSSSSDKADGEKCFLYTFFSFGGQCCEISHGTDHWTTKTYIIRASHSLLHRLIKTCKLQSRRRGLFSDKNRATIGEVYFFIKANKTCKNKRTELHTKWRKKLK